MSRDPGTLPTPAEWVDEFYEQPREKQEAIAAMLLDSAQRTSRCIMQDHDGAIEINRELKAEVADLRSQLATLRQLRDLRQGFE